MKISEQIQKQAEKRGECRAKLEALVKQQEELTETAGMLDAETADDDEMKVFADLKALNDEIEQTKQLDERLSQQLDVLRDTEIKRAATNAQPVGNKAPAFVRSESRKTDPVRSFVRMGIVKALSHLNHQPEQALMDSIFAEDDVTKAMFAAMTKTEAPIATTTGTGYAAELVVEGVRGLLIEAEPTSVAAALANRIGGAGGYLGNFGGDNTARVPRLNPTGANPTEPAWVQEGGAIPVGSVSLGSTILNRYKLAEILVTTMELKERAITDIEALFRRALLASYSKVLDNALLSAGGAVPGVRPAGLMNGITVVAGDTTGGLASVTADIMAMEGELLAINQGAVPVLLLNNRNRRALGFVTSALGEFVFQAQLASGQIFEVPVVASANVPYNTAIMVDASSLAMVLDAPMFDISQVATVVMSNADTTAPTMADDGSGAVGNAGEVQDGIQVKPGGATVPVHAAGYEARSMLKPNSEAVRMIAPTSFILMRTGAVAGRNALAW